MESNDWHWTRKQENEKVSILILNRHRKKMKFDLDHELGASHCKLILKDLKETDHEKTIEALKNRKVEVHNVFYLTEKEKDGITSYNSVKKVHEYTNHKSAKHLIYAYEQVGLLEEKRQKYNQESL